jgi:two-component system, NarL family, nitrate/nitrite response regulator NarL
MTLDSKPDRPAHTRHPNPHAVRVLIADDHPVVRVGVRNILAGESAIQVIGEAGDGEEALDQTTRLSPDILLLDIAMPRLSGFDVMRRIVADAPEVKIILLTASISTQQTMEALKAGARGVILKNSLTEHMTEALLAVKLGNYWIDGKRVINLTTAMHELSEKAAKSGHKTYGLTPREMEVVGCIVEGCSNKDIAKQFKLSEETVKRHLSNIFDKTGVSTRLELAMFAIAHELLTPDS